MIIHFFFLFRLINWTQTRREKSQFSLVSILIFRFSPFFFVRRRDKFLLASYFFVVKNRRHFDSLPDENL